MVGSPCYGLLGGAVSQWLLAFRGVLGCFADLPRFALAGPTRPMLYLFPILAPFAIISNMLTLNSIIQRDPEVIAAEADQDLIMVSIATGYYYGLSDVAREIWDAIERPQRVSDVINNLTANYQVDTQSCEEQTLSFLEALLAEDLVRVKDESAR